MLGFIQKQPPSFYNQIFYLGGGTRVSGFDPPDFGDDFGFDFGDEGLMPMLSGIQIADY